MDVAVHLSSIVSLWNSETKTKDPEIRVELTLTGERSKQHFAMLEEKSEWIVKEIGVPLTWHNPAGKNMCRIYTRQNADFLNEELWPQQHSWLKENLELFYKVFVPVVQTLSVEETA